MDDRTQQAYDIMDDIQPDDTTPMGDNLLEAIAELNESKNINHESD